MSRNEFIGSIPESYGIDARNLVDLRVGENTLNGQLPSQTDGLGHLESFKAEDNRLSGTIPTKWMQLSRLQDFLVAQNVMTGPIPSEVVGMSSLRILGLVSQHSLRSDVKTACAVVAHVMFLLLFCHSRPIASREPFQVQRGNRHGCSISRFLI